MSKTLLVTNDYPPTVGGIQSYLRDFVATLDPADTVVFASTQSSVAAAKYDAAAPERIIRWPRSVMLPTAGTAEAMAEIIEEFEIDTVWFGAAAPLGLLARRAREAGAQRIIVSTHGHEVGWSMLPGARQVLRLIGSRADVVTYISDYTLGRIRRAFGRRPEFAHLPGGVDTDYFRPATPEQRERTRDRHGLGDAPVILCVSRLVRRKGQDQLIAVLPEVREQFPDARLVIVGSGPDDRRLRRLAAGAEGVHLLGALPREQMRDLIAAADVFAMPARTRGGGLDVEGLGIVYLEAQACGIPVIAGESGGAPETVRPETGVVVDGRERGQLTSALVRLLGDPAARAKMGASGREYVCEHWDWKHLGARLRALTTL